MIRLGVWQRPVGQVTTAAETGEQDVLRHLKDRRAAQELGWGDRGRSVEP